MYMKLSAKDIIRMLMRINKISYSDLSEKTGYNLSTGSQKTVSRDDHMQLRTFAKFLSVFGAKIIVRYPYLDGTELEVELETPRGNDDPMMRA